MKTIYEPRGRAREYSPLALNVYNQCDHHCRYCYIPIIQKKYGHGIPSSSRVYPRQNILAELRKEAKRYSFGKQVLLCFMGDPYCRADVEYKTTRNALGILLKNQVTVAILTKGGKRCLRDLDLFRQFDVVKVGATLTLVNDTDSLKWEPYAALPKDRMETLKKLKENGIKTWVSFEPVIDVKQTLQLIDMTHEFIDQYKVGKLNHYDSHIDWRDFGIKAIQKLNSYGKKFYVKKDLAAYIPRRKLTEEQMDMDYLAIRGNLRTI